jgi:hypothetical protein
MFNYISASEENGQPKHRLLELSDRFEADAMGISPPAETLAPLSASSPEP